MSAKEITSENLPTDADRAPAGGLDGLAPYPQKSGAAHIALCSVCGQSFDMRELDQVLHHGLDGEDRDASVDHPLIDVAQVFLVAAETIEMLDDDRLEAPCLGVLQ